MKLCQSHWDRLRQGLLDGGCELEMRADEPAPEFTYTDIVYNPSADRVANEIYKLAWKKWPAAFPPYQEICPLCEFNRQTQDVRMTNEWLAGSIQDEIGVSESEEEAQTDSEEEVLKLNATT